MIAVDTNILVRILIDEPRNAKQIESARRLFAAEGRVFVPVLVIVEAIWVLKGAYEIKKPELLQVLNHLLSNAAFILEESEVVSNAVALYSNSSADFSDCLIRESAGKLGVEVFTFDKRFSRLDGVKLLLS